MSWKDHARAHLAEHLDKRGDLAPPWERFPTYERYTIGWRMGEGESWLGMWAVFNEELAVGFEARLAYLRRHAPAPVTWAGWVWNTLYPNAPEDDEEDDDRADAIKTERHAELHKMGLIAPDVAYSTWLCQQESVTWPWTLCETPEEAARYWTRDLWFWSRQVSGLRADPAFRPPPVPDAWQACAAPLAMGEAGALDLRRGLLCLACMLAAGTVTPPWQLGLDLADFADSFDDDMGYVDAFRLWGMAAFDDRETLRGYLHETGAPASWEGWIGEQFFLD